MTDQPEVWLRGPIEGVPSELQPIVHSLLQLREELPRWLEDFPDDLLEARPAGVASVGFHLRHIPGVMDRLMTYARGESLSELQMSWLRAEKEPADAATVRGYVDDVTRAIDEVVAQLSRVDPATLGDARGVGRAQLPSTVRGLLFHAAEHAQRHLGQLLVTARVAKAMREAGESNAASRLD